MLSLQAAQACPSVGRISSDLAVYLEIQKGTPFQKLAAVCRISQRTVFRVLAKLRSLNLVTNLTVISDKVVSLVTDLSVPPVKEKERSKERERNEEQEQLPLLSPKAETSTSSLDSGQKRICQLFKRRETTPWTLKEKRAYKLYGTRLTEEDWQSLEKYYNAKIERDRDYRRRDISTFLNHLPGELDRAFSWNATQTKTLSNGLDPSKRPW